MARQYIGFTARGPTTFRNVRQSDRIPTVIMNEGEVRTLTLDLAPLLETGETISTATVTANGVTATIANTTTAATLTLSSPTAHGEVTPTLTLSSGEKIIEMIKVRMSLKDADRDSEAYAL